MKYSTNSSEYSTNESFHEQAQKVANIYEHWNSVERTVVICALLKRLPFPNLKLIAHAIDQRLKEITTPQQIKLQEEAANSTSYLNKLIQRYNSLTNFTSSNDNIDANSDQEFNFNDNNNGAKSLEHDLVSKSTNKDDIMLELLSYVPLLRPNNDETKKVYIQFLPVLIDDAFKQYLPIELVQRLLSYLIIHPGSNAEDKK